jgi:hypothetical protein
VTSVIWCCKLFEFLWRSCSCSWFELFISPFCFARYGRTCFGLSSVRSPPLSVDRWSICHLLLAHVCVRSVSIAHVFSCGVERVLLEKLDQIFSLHGVAVRSSIH